MLGRSHHGIGETTALANHADPHCLAGAAPSHSPHGTSRSQLHHRHARRVFLQPAAGRGDPPDGRRAGLRDHRGRSRQRGRLARLVPRPARRAADHPPAMVQPLARTWRGSGGRRAQGALRADRAARFRRPPRRSRLAGRQRRPAGRTPPPHRRGIRRQAQGQPAWLVHPPAFHGFLPQGPRWPDRAAQAAGRRHRHRRGSHHPRAGRRTRDHPPPDSTPGTSPGWKRPRQRSSGKPTAWCPAPATWTRSRRGCAASTNCRIEAG